MAFRLTKAERGLIRELLEAVTKPADKKIADSILTKLEVSELVKGKGKPAGLDVRVAIKAFREVLGDRLVSPPSGAHGVYAQMASRIKSLGLDEEGCRRAATVAAAIWKGPVKAESIVRQADFLLNAPTHRLVKEVTPIAMEDID